MRLGAEAILNVIAPAAQIARLPTARAPSGLADLSVRPTLSEKLDHQPGQVMIEKKTEKVIDHRRRIIPRAGWMNFFTVKSVK